MSDLIDDAAPGPNAHEYTVSEISGAVKRVIEEEFGQVRVRGEIGRVSRPASGHLYFDLKDDKSVIAAISWKGQAARLSVRPEEGMEVIATGRMTTFPGQSKYQLIVDAIEPAGAGALMAMLEARKKALAAEGLFAPELKKKLPFLPEVIGVITSPSGAVIRDILHRLRDRFPRQVLIWPVAVQGQSCAPEVARAIAGFNALQLGGPIPRPDLLIVARGGGSVEDLWGFNEEIVARAAAASEIPLISAVGHETDTTLLDFVADVRAPTPTAAAELAVPVRLDLLNWVREQEIRLSRAAAQAINQRSQRLRDLSRALPKPGNLLDTPRQRLDRAADRLPLALRANVQRNLLRLREADAGLRPRVLASRIERHRERASDLSARLSPALGRHVAEGRRALTRTSARLIRDRLDQMHVRASADYVRLFKRLSSAAMGQVDRWSKDIETLDRTRQTLGYTETLKRGYAVVRGDGAVVTTAQAAGKAGALEIEFADGRLPIAGGAPSKTPSKAKKPPEQGSLF